MLTTTVNHSDGGITPSTILNPGRRRSADACWFSPRLISSATVRPSICVAIPAKDEEERLPRLLEDLADQQEVYGAIEVWLHINGSTDRSLSVAQRTFRETGLNGGVLESKRQSSGGVGLARRIVTDWCCDRFELPVEGNTGQLTRHDHDVLPILAFTDADCRVDSDWLANIQRVVMEGFDAVAGQIEVEYSDLQHSPANADESARRVPRIHEMRRAYFQQTHAYRKRMLQPHDLNPSDHHYNCGASLAVTSAAYRAVGGFAEVAFREDVDLWDRLRIRGFHTCRDRSVKVRTSGRTLGRCQNGLASQLHEIQDGHATRWTIVESPVIHRQRFETLALIAEHMQRKEVATILQHADQYMTRLSLPEAARLPQFRGLVTHGDATRFIAWVERETRDLLVKPTPLDVAIGQWGEVFQDYSLIGSKLD